VKVVPHEQATLTDFPFGALSVWVVSQFGQSTSPKLFQARAVSEPAAAVAFAGAGAGFGVSATGFGWTAMNGLPQLMHLVSPGSARCQ
jgi:hypothetical protein